MPTTLELGMDCDEVTAEAEAVEHLVEVPIKRKNSRSVMGSLNNIAGVLGSGNVMLAASAYVLSLGVAASADHKGQIPADVITDMETAIPILKATVERYERAIAARKKLDG